MHNHQTIEMQAGTYHLGDPRYILNNTRNWSSR